MSPLTDDHRASLEIDRMLRLVREERPAVLHLGDFRVGIMRVRPIVIRAFLLPVPIDPRQSARVGVSMPEACASFVRNS